MLCPKCNHADTRVVDSRDTNDNREIRRRRECEKCEHRFTTFEKYQTGNFIVIKRDSTREPYDREKLERGVWRALEKRQVTPDQVTNLLNELENEWAKAGKEVKSEQIGEGIMRKLKDIDEVAYIRFASVYRDFKDIESFEKELKALRD